MRIKALLGISAFILFISILNPVSADNSKKLDNLMKNKVDKYIAREMKEAQIPGLSVAVVQGTEIEYIKGYGVADSKKTPVTSQTPFYICSVGKTFTALAIRQLANEGKLDYNAPVQKYVPWFTLSDSDAASKIKISNLINHTSGLSSQSGVEAYLYSSKYSVEELVRKMKRVSPVSLAGEKEEYSNLNFLILGLVVEKVAGVSYEKYIQDNIFDKLDMKHSFLSEESAKKDGLATGHTLIYGFTIPTYVPFPKGHVAAGFQMVSVEDMARFVTLYMNNGYYQGKSIIPNNELPELKAPYKAYQETDKRYGLYWMEESGNPQGTLGYYGHVGSDSNFTTVMLLNPKLKTSIVVLANCMNGFNNPEITAQTIGNGIAYLLETGNIPEERKVNRTSIYINILVSIIIFIILGIRAVWIKRFRHNITAKRAKRIISLSLFILVDLILPMFILLGIPQILDCTWVYLVNVNPKLWYPVVFTTSMLFAIFIVKTAIIIKLLRKKTTSREV